MSTKQLRKLIEKNERNEKKEESDESGDDSVPNPDINRFSLLEGEPDEEDDEKSDENVSGHVLPVVPPKSKSTKKLKKRNKKKMKKTDVEISDGVIAQTSEVIPDTANDRKMLIFERDFFRIDTRALDADEELRRLIGSRLSATSSSNRHRKHLIPGRIIKRKPFWPEVKAAGISMVFDHSENGIDWFRFIHHGHYRVAQQSYWEAAESMDQSLIAAILQAYPYHLDSLLVMAEYLRMQEDFQQARDLIERGIFCCESALAPRFQLTNYDHRIDYNDFENRAFFLLLNRYLRDSVKRCCFTTAFNVAKLVFSLDPVNDPLAVLLVIDSIAIRAHQYSFLIDMFENLKFSRNLERLPNFAFSVPLAYYMRSLENNSEEDRDKADSLIAVAIRHYPTLLIQLLDKMNVKPDDKVENNPYMSSLAHNRESEGIKLLTSIYASHTSDLWQTESVLPWLETTTQSALASFVENKEEMQRWASMRKTLYVGTPRNVQRHAWLWEVVKNISSGDVTDPVPPIESRTTYIRVERSRSLSDSFLGGLLLSLIPDYDQHSLEEMSNRLLERFGRMFQRGEGEQVEGNDEQEGGEEERNEPENR